MRSRWLIALQADALPEELPILARTRNGFATLLSDDMAPRRRIAAALMSDPALALRALQRANAVKHRHFSSEVVMLEDAAHMLGTQQLLQLESQAIVAEETMDEARLSHYLRGAGRAVLAAFLAVDWAEVDRDRFPSEVGLAALLNNLGELYLLAHSDARIWRYFEMVDVLHVLPHEAEYVTLGESLEELGYLLAVQWRLPEMVREAMRARNALHLRTLCVMLATQTARYAISGWRHPRQLADLQMAAEILDLDMAALFHRINSVLTEFNAIAADYGLGPLKLLPLNVHEALSSRLAVPETAYFCLAPRHDDFTVALTYLREGRSETRDAVFGNLLRGLHRGVGLNRVVFAAYSPRTRALSAEYLSGTDFEPAFNRFTLPLEGAGLFSQLMKERSAVWFRADDGDATDSVPDDLRELIGVSGFFAASLWVDGTPLGILYADRRSECCGLDRDSFNAFLQLAEAATAALAPFGSGPANRPAND